MSLSIDIRQSDHVVILELTGRLSIVEPALRHVAWELIQSGELYFIINLGKVSYLDNSGVGQLCWIYTVLRNRGGDMVLLKPTPRIRTMLEITRLNTVFQSFDSEEEATRFVRSFRSTVSASARSDTEVLL